jgi:hypothetical protein
LRVPGTINSKYGNTISITQKGDEESIQLDNIQDIEKKGFDHIIRKFENWLIQQKLNNKIQELKLSKQKNFIRNERIREIKWIERLLQTPMDDKRYFCLWKILIPYLVNIKGLSDYIDIYNILIKWLDMCNELRRLSFEPKRTIKIILKGVRGFRPLSPNTLKKDNIQVYDTLANRGCFN